MDARHLPPDLDPGTVDLTAAGSLPAAWSAHWRRDPGREVLQEPGGRWLTAAELHARSAAVAGRFARAGLRPGDRVVMSAAASDDLVVAHVAALRASLVVVPANTAYTEREMAHVVGDSNPVLVICDRAETAAALRHRFPAVVVCGPDVDLPDGPAPALDRARPADPALIGYTSGTTGAPKGAVLSHGNLLASSEALRLAWRWTADDTLVLCLPLFHMHGLGVGLHGTLLAGARAILQRGFDLDAVLAACGRATMYFGVPTMYVRLADAPDLAPLAGLRLMVSGSAPLPAEIHRRIAERCAQRVLERYGMTETVMLVSNPYDGERRAGTVGFPLPGVEVRLAERDEICVRGPNVFEGYWNNAEATQSAFTDGWFHTGDVGAFDADGYLRIVGRTKELIISGGFNVYPREVEDVLRDHPSIADVAVVGTPSLEWGEVVTAFVVAEPGQVIDSDQISAWAAERLAGFKRPRIIHRIDELPRNSLGKVLRHQLTAPDSSTP